MIVINRKDDLYSWKGKELGVSEWLEVGQPMIDAFATATGDYQWIHVDTAKAALSPFGGTIAHGFLLLALLPRFKYDMVQFKLAKAVINYGSDKVRFITPVKVNSRVRLRVSLEKIEEAPNGVKLYTNNNLELEGSERSALVAETITLLLL